MLALALAAGDDLQPYVPPGDGGLVQHNVHVSVLRRTHNNGPHARQQDGRTVQPAPNSPRTLNPATLTHTFLLGKGSQHPHPSWSKETFLVTILYNTQHPMVFLRTSAQHVQAVWQLCG